MASYILMLCEKTTNKVLEKKKKGPSSRGHDKTKPIIMIFTYLQMFLIID